uniref:Uncharacterized protein n=1 Tax=Solanum tuberosum TaxID=4113 RepID=M1CJ10_SOLTU
MGKVEVCLLDFAAGRNMRSGSGEVSELPKNKTKEKEKGFLGGGLAGFQRNSGDLITDKF